MFDDSKTFGDVEKPLSPNRTSKLRNKNLLWERQAIFLRAVIAK